MAKTGRPRRGPWFRKSDQCYYTTFNGQQQNLGSDETQAWKQYSDLMAGREPVISSSRRTVAKLIDEFLEWTKQNRAERTYEWYRDHLRRFFQRIGPRLRVADLKPYHVSQWLTADYAGHSSSNRHGAIRSVQRALNWAVKEGYIVVNPVAKMEKPTPRPRETTITDQQFRQMLGLAKGLEFKDYIEFMRETGARPFEVRTVEARHFDGEKLIFEKINSKGERYNRVVYLNPRAQEIIERLVRDHPTGPLFRNSKGRPWTRNSVRCRFRRLKDKLSIPELCATTLRHTWATDSLRNGIDSTTASILMGHRDPATLARNYQHLTKDHDYLKDAARRARDGENREPNPGPRTPE